MTLPTSGFRRATLAQVWVRNSGAAPSSAAVTARWVNIPESEGELDALTPRSVDLNNPASDRVPMASLVSPRGEAL